MSTTLSRLHTSLLSGWDRAILISLAEDLGHELVDLVLPLPPEAAPELLRLLADHQGYNELWLLRIVPFDEEATRHLQLKRPSGTSRATTSEWVCPQPTPARLSVATASSCWPRLRTRC